jgi:hypothetical protein
MNILIKNIERSFHFWGVDYIINVVYQSIKLTSYSILDLKLRYQLLH